jgi:hypothetical protein
VTVAAVPAAGDPDLPVLRADLSDSQFLALWDRLRTVRPSLEHFAPSPQLAATSLEIGIDAPPGGWVEIRRLGSARGDAWAVRAGGLDADAVDRLRALLDGRRVKPEPTPEVVARRRRLHRINMRVALALAIMALGGLLMIEPLLVIPT